MSVATTSLPPLLAKATADYWPVYITTKTGQQFLCSGIEQIDDDWIHLKPAGDQWILEQVFVDGPLSDKVWVIKERGIDMRLDAIAWVTEGIS